MLSGIKPFYEYKRIICFDAKVKEKTMAGKKFWFGILVIVLVFGMMAAGCDNGTTGSSDLDGTWISTTAPDGTNYQKAVASNGSFNQYMAPSKTAETWKEVIRGTYPSDAKSPVTLIPNDNTYEKIGVVIGFNNWFTLDLMCFRVLRASVRKIFHCNRG